MIKFADKIFYIILSINIVLLFIGGIVFFLFTIPIILLFFLFKALFYKKKQFSFLFPNINNVNFSVFIYFIISLSLFFCSTFETFGGLNQGIHHPCGIISKIISEFVYNIIPFPYMFIILFLIIYITFSYVLRNKE